jgi:hypothetical protein
MLYGILFKCHQLQKCIDAAYVYEIMVANCNLIRNDSRGNYVQSGSLNPVIVTLDLT